MVLTARGGILLGELDPRRSVHVIDLADVLTVGPQDFHVLTDLGWLDHRTISMLFNIELGKISARSGSPLTELT
jgi:hypothetical protein